MRTTPCVLVAAALLGSLSAVAAAAPGAPDTSLGPGGQKLVQSWILTGLGEDDTVFRDLRALATGNLLVLAEERCALGCQADLVAGRLTAEGVPVGLTRRPGSVVDTDDPTRLGALALSDGRVLVAYGEGSAGSLSVIGADGSDQGRRELGRPVVPVAELPDGAVLATVVTPYGLPAQLVRLTTDLAIDPAFGVGGVATLPALGEVRAAGQTGGSIFVAGSAPRGPALVRLSESGAILGVRGVTRPAWVARRAPGVVSGIGVRPAGGVLVAVSGAESRTTPSGASDTRSYIAAFGSTGTPDRAFGRRGATTLADDAIRVAVQPDGRAVTASAVDCEYGWLEKPPCRVRITTRRFTAGGRADPSFPARSVRARARYLAGWDMDLDSRGRIVVAGGAFTTYGRSGLLLARFLTR